MVLGHESKTKFREAKEEEESNSVKVRREIKDKRKGSNFAPCSHTTYGVQLGNASQKVPWLSLYPTQRHFVRSLLCLVPRKFFCQKTTHIKILLQFFHTDGMR